MNLRFLNLSSKKNFFFWGILSDYKFGIKASMISKIKYWGDIKVTAMLMSSIYYADALNRSFLHRYGEILSQGLIQMIQT